MDKKLYDAIDETIVKFNDCLYDLLDENLFSIILFGSAVLDDFVPGKGDLDFMVVTKNSITINQIDQLFKLHDQIRAGSLGSLGTQLEGTYYPVKVIQNPLKATCRGCYIGTKRSGWKRINSSCNSLADYLVVKNHGKMYLNDIKELVYKPNMMQLKIEFMDNLNKNLAWNERLKDVDMSLSMFHWAPRGLYTLSTGACVSKTEAAKWFYLNYINSPFATLVLEAAKYRYPLSQAEKRELAKILPDNTKQFLLQIKDLAGKR